MIFQSFLLGNLVSLCMKIINSVVVIGLYYGFLTTFSIGPSYLFLLRARVMEEGGTEKKVSATTGFIMGQLMVFISIYYTPLHLALGRPHTITVLALPYLLFHFFWKNHKYFFDCGSTTRNSMRNLSIQCVFLNNLIFQLFNHFILPSSMLARLVNIYMFRCNNKMFFLTSSFVGWLIGHILFMKWVGLVLVWIRQNPSIRSNKYLVSELRNSMARIFSILFFITCVYYLGRMPSPILTKKLKETSETKEKREGEEETDVEIETTSETKETKQEQERVTEEDASPFLFSEEKEDPEKIDETEKIRMNGKDKTKDEFHFYLKEAYYKNSPTSSIDGNQENSKFEIEMLKEEEKDLFWFEKPLVTLLFDYKRWNRPLRYLKNNRFENAVRKEMSQYFFHTCQNDGKKRISFTYPPSLSAFWEMIERKMSFYTYKKDKLFFDELQNSFWWIYTNEQKKNNLRNEFSNRIEILDTGSFFLDILETKTQLCNDKHKKEYLPKKYDPFLKGFSRGIIKEFFLPSETVVKKSVEKNKLHNILFNDFEKPKLEHKKYKFEKESFSIEPAFNENWLVSDQEFISSEEGEKLLNLLFDVVIINPMNNKQKSTEIKEISKKVPRWSYKLIDDLEQQEREKDEDVAIDPEIRSRKGKRVVIFTDTEKTTNPFLKDTESSDQADEVALIRYSQQSDFRRDIIKGSMRVQRRKIVISELFQANVHSPLFFDRLEKSSFFSFDISRIIKRIFKKKYTELKNFDSIEEEWDKNEDYEGEEEKKKEQARIEIAETWDTILFAQGIRGLMLVTQSIIRKYFILPLLIIVKNIGRLLFLQLPEWSEDIKAWNREMHVKCTYNGVQLSETEFPKNWLKDGIQIKILFPFSLKPWHKSRTPFSQRDRNKEKKIKDDFCFLTIWGMETEFPFGSPRKKYSFFKPIFKELEKKIIKIRKTFFRVLKIFKERTKFLIKVPKEKWILKKFQFIKTIIKKISKVKKILAFPSNKELRGIKNKKDYRINNLILKESSIQTQSMDWTKYSLTEKKLQDLTDKISTIRKKKERITKEKISPNTTSYSYKKLEAPKSLFLILKRRTARLIRKPFYFIKFLGERIYIDIFLSIIKIFRMKAKPLVETTKKFIEEISNNQKTKERIDKTNQNKIPFIYTIKKSLSFLNTINRNLQSNFKDSKVIFDLSFLSQAYVFYKISQNKVMILDQLRSVFKHHGTPFFIKNEIKNSFQTHGIILSGLKDQSYGTNEWKDWLKKHYEYDLSNRDWFKLVPQKWRIKLNKSIHYKKEKENNLKTYLMIWPKKKENFQKIYRYDLLSYKSIDSENTKYSDFYGLPFQRKQNEKISYSSNYNTHKKKIFAMWGNIPINKYLVKKDFMDMEKNTDRKDFDWTILNFCLRNKADIEAWISITTNSKKSIKTGTKNYKMIDKMDKKSHFDFIIHQEKNSSNKKRLFFDWMGMNEEILKRPISNLELWFFPEFVLFYNRYKKKPWVIPIKSLFFNFNVSEIFSVSKNKCMKKKQKKETLVPSNDKKVFELAYPNQEEKESINQKNTESDAQNQGHSELVLSTQQNEINEDYKVPDIKKGRKKKKYKSSTEAELFFFLKKYLLFQLRWDDPLSQKMINNIKVYCLLLRLINPKEIAISSIERREMSLDIMLIQKDFTLTKLMKKGIFIIEPIRLSVKGDGELIMYQTVSISLVDKGKDQKNKKKDRENVNKKEFVVKNKKLIKKIEKNKYDLIVPENILSSIRRRELRILICFNSRNKGDLNQNKISLNRNIIKNCGQFLDEKNDLNRDQMKFIQLKLFLWPNSRIEDLACMNRYWFHTNNGSRFSMLRIHMYPQLKIH
uniref:Translocon at the inner envelope membrane of chloroplasts 214 n=1 Tax=Frankenia pulverulenta TaxID=63091 RepID=A0A411JRG9_9CARY|nr:hypothetical protein RF1 [Frankenia pulverulenta]QBC67676.1 hypothetical protein RF1 [Frankenia pulverulenta]